MYITIAFTLMDNTHAHAYAQSLGCLLSSHVFFICSHPCWCGHPVHVSMNPSCFLSATCRDVRALSVCVALPSPPSLPLTCGVDAAVLHCVYWEVW